MGVFAKGFVFVAFLWCGYVGGGAFDAKELSQVGHLIRAWWFTLQRDRA